MQKWGFNEDGQTTCECGNEQTMTHQSCWSAKSCHNPVPMKTWKGSTPEIYPAPSIGRKSCSDSRRRRPHYAFFVSTHALTFRSPFLYRFESLRHSRCPSDGPVSCQYWFHSTPFVVGLIFACHSLLCSSQSVCTFLHCSSHFWSYNIAGFASWSLFQHLPSSTFIQILLHVYIFIAMDLNSVCIILHGLLWNS